MLTSVYGRIGIESWDYRSRIEGFQVAISVRCPKCSNLIQCEKPQQGKLLQCPGCGRRLQLRRFSDSPQPSLNEDIVNGWLSETVITSSGPVSRPGPLQAGFIASLSSEDNTTNQDDPRFDYYVERHEANVETQATCDHQHDNMSIISPYLSPTATRPKPEPKAINYDHKKSPRDAFRSMSLKQRLSSIKTYAIGVVIVLALLALTALFIEGTVWVGEKILPWLMLLSSMALAFDILIVLPLAFVPRTRPWAGLGFFISSYVFGLCGWFMGLLLTWMLWGGCAVAVGLFAIGIGVVPIAMLATLFSGMWLHLGLLILVVILTYGLRVLGETLMEEHNGRP